MFQTFRHILTVLTALLLFPCTAVLISCRSSEPKQSEARQKDEAKALEILNKARKHLRDKQYDAARQQLRSLRKESPLALNGREAGILLKDSVEIAATADRLRIADSLVQAETQRNGSVSRQTQVHFDELCQQAKFYHRKLQHDIEQRKSHD